MIQALFVLLLDNYETPDPNSLLNDISTPSAIVFVFLLCISQNKLVNSDVIH